MNTRLLSLFAAAVLTLPASAQVYKCKTPTGGTLVSDRPCDGANKTVDVRRSEPVTLEQQMQAAEVQQRRRQQLGQMEAEESAHRARLAEREAQRAPEISPEMARRRQQLCDEASTPMKGSQGGLTASQRSVLASCAGLNVPAPAPASIPIPVPIMPSAALPPPPPSVITSCDPGGCSDSNGNRYNGTAGQGAFHRQDGRFCLHVGDQMQCN
ncbi:MAG: DUF4124 domain-containing protein [Azovibrio sp.]|uniref:DUF4124 domain-containing protein n=1 Tax=Azovibrio sp. TaxID=1872673 RepID=UPI003C74697E